MLSSTSHIYFNKHSPYMVKPVFDLLSLPIINNIPPLKPLSQCPICLLYYVEVYRPNCCSHTFCNYCITKWSKIKKQCPLCRKSFINLFIS